MINPTGDPNHKIEHKLTAVQVEGDCPPRLREIGKEIRERLKKAERQAEVAQNHLIAIDQLLAEAKELCDGGGFNKFRELFCPQLGKSQAYVLLAIADGKKTLAEHRAEERQRKKKTRAKQKTAVNSGTVPEKSGAEAEGTPIDIAPADAPSTAPEEAPEPAKPRRGVTSKDEACFDFTARVLDLIRRTRGQRLDRFVTTAVKADDLAKLGKYITDLANLITSRAVKPTPISRGNDTVSAEQSAEAMKAAHAANDPQHGEAQ